MAKMQEELATLQQEKDKLDKQDAAKGKSNDPTCKISEQRRKRIQELETQVSAMFVSFTNLNRTRVFFWESQ